jgi:hypothetical protein
VAAVDGDHREGSAAPFMLTEVGFPGAPAILGVRARTGTHGNHPVAVGENAGLMARLGGFQKASGLRARGQGVVIRQRSWWGRLTRCEASEAGWFGSVRAVIATEGTGGSDGLLLTGREGSRRRRELFLDGRQRKATASSAPFTCYR